MPEAENNIVQVEQAILKVASRCNLNCSYCYVYNMADTTWQRRPPLMSDAIFDLTLERIAASCRETGQSRFKIVFHGGEPCLLGPEKFGTWCGRAREQLDHLVHLGLIIQTNGTLLDRQWIDAFKRHKVNVGITLDGPKAIHDRARVDHKDRGSYDQVVRGLRLLQNGGVPYGVGCVIPLGADPIAIHRHFLELGCAQITYLMPHATHDTVAPLRAKYGPTPCADFLIQVFDEWWFEGTTETLVSDLKNVARVIMGGRSRSEAIGNEPPGYVFVETDGEIEGLDTLRACDEGLARTSLNIATSSFADLRRSGTMHYQAIFEGMPLAEACRRCPEGETCRGGHLPHRYSARRGFDNPSVWCADLLKLFGHVRGRMGVSVEETRERRRLLAAGDMAGLDALEQAVA